MAGITNVFILVMFSVTCGETLLRPKRAWIIDSFTMVEEHPGPFPYTLGHIKLERKYSVQYSLHGNGIDEDPKGLLIIDPKTGIVNVTRSIDYEKYKELRLQFVAKNMSNLRTDTKLGLEIVVEDINDNPPRFQRDVYETTITEAAKQGSYVMTVLAYDADKPGTVNATFSYRITAVKPNTPNAEFFIQDTGAISFKGCLDYDIAQKYIISVEAKDHGPISLSGSTTVIVHVQDANNHLPVITGHSGTGVVREGEIGVSPLQIHVTDEDTQGSPAWRVTYTLHGEISAFFQAETDPATNNGILTLLKPLDFEDGVERTVSVSVENEEAYFYCMVEKKTVSGLWTVTTSQNMETMKNTIHHQKFTITVEDTNDPPMFKIPVKDAVVMENENVGRLVEEFTAVDPDPTYSNDFEYIIGYDPAKWVRVDSKNGQIFLADTPDRESVHIVNNIYTVILLAVDHGDPRMTGTATLNIHVQDQNDNVPVLTESTVGMCASNGTLVISARDLDGEPYGGPFTFQLLGGHTGWTLDPDYGMSVNLKKESVVFSGHHTLTLKISDKQGQFSVQNLSVTVCDCALSAGCLLGRRTSISSTAGGAAGIIFLALFLLLGVLLLVFLGECGTKRPVIEVEHGPGSSLRPFNTEIPGTDCEVPITWAVGDQKQTVQKWNYIDGLSQHFKNNQQILNKHKSCYDIYGGNHRYSHIGKYSEDHQDKNLYAAGIGLYHSAATLSHNESQHSHRYSGFYQHQNTHFKKVMATQDRQVAQQEFTTGHRATLESLLELRLSSVKATEVELCDYEPCEYAYEGDPDTPQDLDPIPISEPVFDPDQLLDLDPTFFALASICLPMPEHCLFKD